MRSRTTAISPFVELLRLQFKKEASFPFIIIKNFCAKLKLKNIITLLIELIKTDRVDRNKYSGQRSLIELDF